VALPRFLLRLIDPAQVYFEQHRLDRPRGGAPVHREAVVFGPGVPGGSRPATADELAEMRLAATRHRADHEAAVADARQRWAAELERAATELRDTGTTQLRLGDRTVDARIVRFWRGDDVLHIVATGPDERGESLTRISRGRGADVLLDYLARAAAKA
jgi:hypothetical protein